MKQEMVSEWCQSFGILFCKSKSPIPFLYFHYYWSTEIVWTVEEPMCKGMGGYDDNEVEGRQISG